MTSQTKMSNTGKLMSALLLSSVLTASAAHAGKHERGHHDGGWASPQHMDRMAKKLELTDGQQEQVKQSMQAHREQMKPLREEQRALRDEIGAQQGVMSEAAIRSYAQRQGVLSSQLTEARLRKQADFMQILDPTQRDKLATMKAKRKQKMEERREKKREYREAKKQRS